MESCTSASDMRFKYMVRIQDAGLRVAFICILIAFSLQFSVFSYAGLLDRVVAFVDNRAITLSELEDSYGKAKELKKGLSRKEVLEAMINRILLMKEARSLKLEANTDEELIKEYIDLKVRAFVRIKEIEVEDFYNKNLPDFKGASFESVREKIEEYLLEREVNAVLKKHIAELRERAYVKIVLPEP